MFLITVDVTCGSRLSGLDGQYDEVERCPKWHCKRKSGDMTRAGREKANAYDIIHNDIPRNSVFTCKLQRIILLFVS